MFNLSKEELKLREVVYVDIAAECEESRRKKIDVFKVRAKDGRPPITGLNWWKSGYYKGPLMCCYKLCRSEFAVFGLQTIGESKIVSVYTFYHLNLSPCLCSFKTTRSSNSARPSSTTLTTGSA